MGLYLKQQDTRTPLQDKIAKELQEKARQKAAEADLPDGVDDSRFIERTKQTTSLAWLWGLVALAAIGATVFLLVVSASQ